MKKDLSIIIVTWNTKKLLLDCIDSITASKPKVDYEIIVVDNGSEEKERISTKDRNIKIIQNKENLGFAKANNQGIKVAKGKYILLLNSDTEVKKGSIDKLYEAALSNPKAGAVCSKLLNPDGSSQGSVFRLPGFWRTIRQYWLGEKGLLDKFTPVTDHKISVPVEAASMAAFLITPKALEKVGLLDERYFMYFEDMDYCKRVKKAGLSIYFVPESEVIHHHGASGKDLADEKNQWRRLIPSSKLYYGSFIYSVLSFIHKTGQKFGKFIPLVLVTLFTIPSFHNLLRPGFFPMQDDLQAFRVYEMDRCYDNLQIPCRWVPDAGYQYGYPQFNYYPPLPYYLGAGLHRVGIQYIDAVKILFVAGYLLSAITMYLLVTALFKSSWIGIVAGALYTYIPYKAVEVFVRGALSEFWAQIFFPLIFWAIYKLIKSGKIKYLLWLALSIAFLATTHVLMTIIFIPVAGIWALYWLFREKWNNLVKIIWSGVLGFGLSAFFILPVAFERKFAHVESLLSGYFDYRQHFVSLYKLFISREWGYGSSGFPNEKLNLSLGIVQWGFAIIVGLFALIRIKKDKKISILAILLSLVTLFSIFMMHIKSSFIWAKLPFMWYLQFPWRFLAVSIFLLVVVSGFGLYFAGKFKYILGIVLIVASFALTISFFVPKSWDNITDSQKFSEASWEKQLTISIFDYLPIYATLPPWQKAPDLPEVMGGKATFTNYQKGSDFQKGNIDVQTNSLIRLPLFDFPGMEVKVDGKVVSHVNDDCRNERYCLGLITFSIPSGNHKIEAKLTDTPIRKVGNILTLLSLFGLGALVIKSRRNG